MPSLQSRTDSGSSIVVISEHWLWPYISCLRSVLTLKLLHGKADKRPSVDVESGRGCGGIAVLWHGDIGATPIEGLRGKVV